MARVPLSSCRQREALTCGAYQSSGAHVVGPCFIVHLQACLRCTWRIWAVLGEFWRVWGKQGTFFTEFSAGKNLGPHSVTGQKAPKLLDPPGGLGLCTSRRPPVCPCALRDPPGFMPWEGLPLNCVQPLVVLPPRIFFQGCKLYPQYPQYCPCGLSALGRLESPLRSLPVG